MATVLQITNADRYLSLFSRGLRVAELETKLNEIGPYTVLGPVNLALHRLMSLTYEQLLEPINKSALVRLLSSYILIGKTLWSDFRNGQMLQTLDGKQVAVSNTNGEIHVNGAKVLAHDRQGSNGVVHLVGNTYSTPGN